MVSQSFTKSAQIASMKKSQSNVIDIKQNIVEWRPVPYKTPDFMLVCLYIPGALKCKIYCLP